MLKTNYEIPGLPAVHVSEQFDTFITTWEGRRLIYMGHYDKNSVLSKLPLDLIKYIDHNFLYCTYYKYVHTPVNLPGLGIALFDRTGLQAVPIFSRSIGSKLLWNAVYDIFKQYGLAIKDIFVLNGSGSKNNQIDLEKLEQISMMFKSENFCNSFDRIRKLPNNFRFIVNFSSYPNIDILYPIPQRRDAKEMFNYDINDQKDLGILTIKIEMNDNSDLCYFLKIGKFKNTKFNNIKELLTYLFKEERFYTNMLCTECLNSFNWNDVARENLIKLHGKENVDWPDEQTQDKGTCVLI